MGLVAFVLDQWEEYFSLATDEDLILGGVMLLKFGADISRFVAISLVVAPGVDHPRPAAVDFNIIKGDIDGSSPVVIITIKRYLDLKVQVVPPALAGVIDHANELTTPDELALHLEFVGDAVLLQVQVELIGNWVRSFVAYDDVIAHRLVV